MSGERTYAILPFPDLRKAIDFYGALGFSTTYRQLRPNPHAVVAREDMMIHLSGIDGFDPATSVSSVIITVPDLAALYASFADGLRARYGRLPVADIPRILRLRRKQGTATGFSVVDPGGNWLRFYQTGAQEEEPDDRATGLARVLEVAARQGDARGDEDQALVVLERGLIRHPEAAATDRARVLLYRAELLVRTGRPDQAEDALNEATGLVTPAEAAEVADEVAAVRELLGLGKHTMNEEVPTP